MMPVSLVNIRDLLLPGLLEISGRYPMMERQWSAVFAPSLATPHIWVPKLSLPQAAAVGAAAAIIKNPEITRRFWQGWTL